MTRLADLRRRVAATNDLLGIVGAMRSLAGMRLQEAQRALPGMRRYADSLAGGLAAALRLLSGQVPPRTAASGRRITILCASEHGFVGGFNDRLFEHVAHERADLLFVLGSRGAALANERGFEPAWIEPLPARIDGITDAINRVSGELFRRIGDGGVDAVDVVFTPMQTGPAIERRSLLPIDVAALARRQPALAPLHNLDPRLLFEDLAAEYVYARLGRAAVESVASENAARLAAMEAAHDAIERRRDELERGVHEARQTEITDELLDLVTGWEAALDGRRARAPSGQQALR